MKNIKKSILLFSIIALITNNNFSQTCIKAYYPLNNNANDFSGNNFNGTNYGASPTSDSLGNLNSAYLFDGTNSYINLPSDFDYPEKTINLWVYAENITTDLDIIFNSDHSSILNGLSVIYVAEISGIKKMCYNQGGTQRFINISENRWYMTTLVRGTQYSKFYLNAVLVDSVSSGTLHSIDGSTTAKIGCSRKFDRYFQGKIDEVKLYDCQLNHTQIETLFLLTTNCLTAFYPFNNNANDQSGNTLNGTNYYTTTCTDRLGNQNSAYLFNGSSSYIDLPDDFDYPEKTINLWVYAENITTDLDIIFNSDHSSILNGLSVIYVAEISGIKKMCYNQGGTQKFTNISENQWYMTTLVRGTQYTKFYLNAVLVDSVPSGTLHSIDGSTTAKIGCSRKFDRYFQGKIDEVKIYNCTQNVDDLINLFVSSKDNYTLSEKFKVYPNPANNYIVIESSQNATIEILNIQGQMIEKLILTNTKEIIDLTKFTSGIYMIKAKTNNGIIVKKFIKQ